MNNYYKPAREEQETHITFDAVTRLYHIWTTYPQHIRRWNKLGYQPDGRSDGIVFECYVPEHCIKFQPLEKHKRLVVRRTEASPARTHPEDECGSDESGTGR
ncbi:MAG: hypothetical protein MJZ85_11200 [Bacteroidales bacterium]|nr:hypothetical protein [Bacteroidales bacterium]